MMSVPTLRPLQLELAGAILSRRPRVHRWIVGSGRADAGTRLKVYADAYRLRLLEVLHEDFPVLRKLAGEERFDRLARGYIEAHPSDNPSVRWFGRRLSRYLRHRRDVARRLLLAEMAEFEWAQGEVFDAPDAPVAGLEGLAALPPAAWGHLRLQLHPSVRRVKLAWNVPEIWQALDKGQRCPRRVRNPRRQQWALWRRDLRVHWRSLDSNEAAALDAAGSHASFGEICEWLCRRSRSPEAAALLAAGVLKRWISEGLITSWSVDAPTTGAKGETP